MKTTAMKTNPVNRPRPVLEFPDLVRPWNHAPNDKGRPSAGSLVQLSAADMALLQRTIDEAMAKLSRLPVAV